jgi:hypothetical protein
MSMHGDIVRENTKVNRSSCDLPGDALRASAGSPNYFAASCGGAPLIAVRQQVEATARVV